jgi:hypothetical protein
METPRYGPSFFCQFMSRDPQREQKVRMPSADESYSASSSRPRRKRSVARFARARLAKAVPWALRQREQWQLKTSPGMSSASNSMSPQRQVPCMASTRKVPVAAA